MIAACPLEPRGSLLERRCRHTREGEGVARSLSARLEVRLPLVVRRCLLSFAACAPDIMFQASCRQLQRISCHHNAAVKVVSVRSDAAAPHEERAYHGQRGDKRTGDGSLPFSRSFCPFVLARRLSDFVGFIGAGFIVGLKLQRDLSHLKQLCSSDARSPTPEPPPVTHQHRLPLGPLLVLRASPVLSHAALRQNTRPQLLPEQPAKPVSLAPTREESSVSDRRRELVDLCRRYTCDLMNKVGVALVQSHARQEGTECLKANAACARALYNLAVAYETGCEPDLQLAFEYYDRAAQLEHKFATYNLALFYLYGKGPVTRDLATGAALMHKAAALGVDRAAAFWQAIEGTSDREQVVRPSPPQSAPQAASQEAQQDVQSWQSLLSRWVSGSSRRDAVARLAICY